MGMSIFGNVTLWQSAGISHNKKNFILQYMYQCNWTIGNLKGYISQAEYQIDLKPDCTLKFFHCLEGYLRKFITS